METFGEKISAEACSGKEIAGLLKMMMMMMMMKNILNAEGYPSQIWAERPFNPVTTGANVLNARFTARGAFT